MSKSKHRRCHKDNDKHWYRSGKTNHHHDLAKSRGGSWSEFNIFIWDTNAHRAFHFLFGNRTLVEASEWLQHIHEQNLDGNKIDILEGTEDVYAM